MSDEKPYGDGYYVEIRELQEAQDKAAQSYTAQMMYLRLGGKYDYYTPRPRREQVAEEAAQEWLRLDAAIQARQAQEHAKKAAC